MMDLEDEHFVKVILESIEGHDQDLVTNKIFLKKGVIAAGNNYLSEVAQLNLEYTKKGTKKIQNIILKIFSSVPTYETGKLMGVYDKEVEMYRTVLPAMAQFLNNPNDVFFPKAFESLYPDVLVLEDLKPSGYVMMDRTRQLDFEHAAIAYKTMAKFHALSLRLNEISPNIIEKVKNDIFFHTEAGKKIFSDLFEKSFELSTIQLKKNKKTTKYVNSFVNLKFRILDKVQELTQAKTNRMQLLNHGDHWLNNMMFKHDEKGNVINNKLIDFQICRWCSLAIDIWHFAVTSIDFSVFQLHFDSLIAVYLASLNETLERSGSDVRYTFKEVKQEIEDSVAYGIYIMVAFLPIIISDPSDPVDLGQAVEDPENINMEAFAKTYENKLFLNVLASWFLYFNEKIMNRDIF